MMMADFVKAQIPSGGKYAHMMGVVGNSAQIARGKGILKVLKNDSSWESVGDYAADWSGDKAVGFTTDILTEYGNDIKAIICDNDGMSSAVQNYVNSIGREDIVAIGVDGNAGPLAMVKAGTLRATIYQDGAAQVSTAISLIPKIIAGDNVDKEIMVPFVLVTSDNVDQYLK
ncbi:MAG: substrate-binding domain-containing protein, partial [Spirochaetales bacterium]|nr:substrate-binding domain-containing protein [Spirochaetales bacterium]